jgi:hypothetical protein
MPEAYNFKFHPMEARMKTVHILWLTVKSKVKMHVLRQLSGLLAIYIYMWREESNEKTEPGIHVLC